MSIEITQELKQVEHLFQENIRDSFGKSIVNEIFSPLLIELVSLEYLEEEIQFKMIEIDSILSESRSIIR